MAKKYLWESKSTSRYSWFGLGWEVERVNLAREPSARTVSFLGHWKRHPGRFLWVRKWGRLCSLMICHARDLPRGLEGHQPNLNHLLWAGKVSFDFVQVINANAGYSWCELPVVHVSDGLTSLFSSPPLSSHFPELRCKHGHEQEPNLGHDVESMTHRASERCNCRRGVWLDTLYAREICVHPL